MSLDNVVVQKPVQAPVQSQNTPKPGRPLGLSLGIFFCLMLYTFAPLAMLGIHLYINDKFYDMEDMVITLPDGTEMESIMAGSDANLVTPERLIIEGGLSLIFLMVGMLAWLGRPRHIRYVLLAMVVGLAGINAVAIIIDLMRPITLNDGYSSGNALASTFNMGRLIANVLIPLYLAWYINRAPARAFYRGYYLPDPNETKNG